MRLNTSTSFSGNNPRVQKFINLAIVSINDRSEKSPPIKTIEEDTSTKATKSIVAHAQ
jgi:hypothetical protein